jgi:hypothetical protein
MPLNCAACAVAGGAISVAFVVLGLKMMPATKLILVFNLDTRHCMFNILREASRAEAHSSASTCERRACGRKSGLYAVCIHCPGLLLFLCQADPSPFALCLSHLVLSTLLLVLAGTSLALLGMGWLGQWRLRRRGQELAGVFQEELQRRGLIVTSVHRL